MKRFKPKATSNAKCLKESSLEDRAYRLRQNFKFWISLGYLKAYTKLLWKLKYQLILIDLYVSRSIQRIKDIEKVTLVKRVDSENPENRITDSLIEVGFDVESVARLTSKDRHNPTRTIKIIFKDYQNRNTFVQTSLQLESMNFPAEPAMFNNKPVQCYLCLQYNHVAKYCKTKQQLCARCGGNHHISQCSDPHHMKNAATVQSNRKNHH